MFKSIEYRLILFLSLLIISVIAGTYLLIEGQYVYLSSAVLLFVVSLWNLCHNYKKFNKNILFLLNALDNGDYSFHFTESKLSARERELNSMMNRIKDILSKARKEVIENEKFLSLIIESVSTGVLIVDTTGIIRTSNQAALQLLGTPVLTHLKQLKTIDENLPKQLHDLGVNDNLSVKVMNEREEVQLSVQCSIISLKKGTMKILTLSNIGNELEAKEMESWVRLIRVMTHEIMNSVAPITSMSESLLDAYLNENGLINEELKNDTIDALATITSTSKGLISFVDSYRRFTGIPTPQLVRLELKPLLEHVLLLEMPKDQEDDIEIEVNCLNDQVVFADRSQVSQVLINLIKNAIEAISHKADGKVIIDVVDIDKSVKIDIKNNGEPIPADIAPHIFIPFFTTKDGGNGIGLSISRYIMRLHGGNLKHHTNNEWTVFSMVFTKPIV